MILTFIFLLLSQQSPVLEGRWFYCAGEDYVQFHIKEGYFQNCPEYAPYGMTYPYQLSGDTIVYGIPYEEQEIVTRKFQVINQDSVRFLKDFSGKYKEILLIRLNELIEVPSSINNSKILNDYEEAFNKEEKKMHVIDENLC